jgi:DNA repair protein RecO (recombination protein O)
MEWTSEAIILGARPFGETHAIAEVFARGHGRSAGVVHGGVSKRMKPVLQAGNLVDVTWKARTGEQLGHFAPIELIAPHAARLMQDHAALAGLSSGVAMLRAATAERQPHPALYDAFVVLIESLGEGEFWPALYTRFELGLLAEIGYGLDVSVCALTGAKDNLGWVSPKTGRAASQAAGAPFSDKLLRLPPFLTDSAAAIETGDVADAFALSGFFFERRVFDPQGTGLPEARRRLIEALGFQGRL